MAINKVILGDRTLIDISDSTVTSNKLLQNEVAYGSNGEKIVGSLVIGSTDNSLLACLLANGSYGGTQYKSSVLTIPQGCIEIGSSVFERNYTIETLYTEEAVTIHQSAFAWCQQLENVHFGNSLTYIENSAFSDCSMLTTITFPSSLQILGDYVFNGSSLTNITFKGTPGRIGSYAFDGLDSATINVPWSEGAVANAPWGATNATINYNYTG